MTLLIVGNAVGKFSGGSFHQINPLLSGCWSACMMDINGLFSTLAAMQANGFQKSTTMSASISTINSSYASQFALTKFSFIIPAIAAVPLGLKEVKKVQREINLRREKMFGEVGEKAAQRKRLVVVFLIAIVIFPFLIQSFLPNSDWDGAAYHLPLAEN